MKFKDLKGYLIAIDLDGTLIQNFDDYDKQSFELLKVVAKNNHVVISTGRPFRSSQPYYELLNLKTPIVNYNGAWVHNPNDKNFDKSLITIGRNSLLKFVNEKKNIIPINGNVYLFGIL